MLIVTMMCRSENFTHFTEISKIVCLENYYFINVYLELTKERDFSLQINKEILILQVTN